MEKENIFKKHKFFKKHKKLKIALIAISVFNVILVTYYTLFLSAGGGYSRDQISISFYLEQIVSLYAVELTLTIVVLPFILLVIEYFTMVSGKVKRSTYVYDLLCLIFGPVINVNVLIFCGVQFESDWYVQLYNNQMHTPIFTESVPSLIAIGAVGVLGYLIVTFVPLKKMPPLALVIGMAAMYLGAFFHIVCLVQTSFADSNLGFGLLYLISSTLSILFLTIRTVRYKINEWYEIEHQTGKIDKIPVLGWCNMMLYKAERWPIAAFLLMWPLLGIVIGILVLFGQEPDAVIKAFTETSDWAFSEKIAPQNLTRDEHYLCTVASGGHETIVKPIRMGVRHGHEVIVNRQLCIANAFEQILEEKTPRFHKAVRGFYDKYGFPVAKLIKSKYIADAIYLLMKPLEWAFLVVIYLVDVNPENRIAIQYTGKGVKDFF